MSKPTFLADAEALFVAIETGKGWDVASTYCTPDAAFSSDAIPDVKALEVYVNWMAGLISGIAPDAVYELLSTTWNDTQVTFVANFKGHHSLPGGPVPPSDPPKFMSTAYTYTMTFDTASGKCTSMHKVWDKLTAFQGWGWPL